MIRSIRKGASVTEGGRDPGANDACPTVSLPQSHSGIKQMQLFGGWPGCKWCLPHVTNLLMINENIEKAKKKTYYFCLTSLGLGSSAQGWAGGLGEVAPWYTCGACGPDWESTAVDRSMEPGKRKGAVSFVITTWSDVWQTNLVILDDVKTYIASWSRWEVHMSESGHWWSDSDRRQGEEHVLCAEEHRVFWKSC